MIRIASPSTTSIISIYQWLNLFSFIPWDGTEKGGTKDDSRKPATPQKSAGHRGYPFSERRRKVGVFRSLSEASGREESMKRILSPAPEFTGLCSYSPALAPLTDPISKHWGKSRQIGQMQLRHSMPEPQYHFSLSLQMSMDWTSKMRQGMQILGQKVLESKTLKQYNCGWDHEAKSSTSQFPTHHWEHCKSHVEPHQVTYMKYIH